MTTIEIDEPLSPEWKQTACILCTANCGIEVRLDGRRFERIRGDKAHPKSAGYTCEKALRLDHYQNGRHRLTSPMRRRSDGSYEEVDWDTAIAEVAAGLAAVRDTHGGETIFFYGGGGQGNHLHGAHGLVGLMPALGAKYYSNAIAQEKTGELWVNEQFGTGPTTGDFAGAEVAMFVGKNPWQSHHIPEARRTLKAIAVDPARSLVVIDPRRTETAELADFFLQLRPGTDAWCLAAVLGVIVQDDLVDHAFLRDHSQGAETLLAALGDVPVAEFARRCGVPVELIEATARCIGTASSFSIMEDLGMEQAPHSTLSSYLEKLLWMVTGNFGKAGAMNAHSFFIDATQGFRVGSLPEATTPVLGAPIIWGLTPAALIADEILTDHPKRYRALVVESSNPAHSLPDSQRFREAMAALEFSVVIDVAMTETARCADYVLPGASQYEKWETTFWHFEFPHNVFHLRAPVLDPLPGTLPEAEIHARLVRALGVVDEAKLEPLREAAAKGLDHFGPAFFGLAMSNPRAGAARGLRHVRDPRTLPARRRPGGCGSVSAGPVLRPAPPRAAAASRHLRRGVGGRQRPVRGHPLQPFGRDLHSGRLRGHLGLHRSARSSLQRGDPRAPRRAGNPRHRGARRRLRRLPVRAVGRGAPIVHRQHHLPRPGLAEEGFRRLPAHQPDRRRTPRAGGRRPGPGRHRGRRGGSRGRDQPDDAAGPHLAAQRPGPRHGRRGRADPPHRGRPQRSHAFRPTRLAGRHPVAQERPGPGRSSQLTMTMAPGMPGP
ncbi:MAG TPA: molybdopterin-dependent oxidoreductase [Acidimicrobiales bacterium]